MVLNLTDFEYDVDLLLEWNEITPPQDGLENVFSASFPKKNH